MAQFNTNGSSADAELVVALQTILAGLEGFWTATCTNAKGRDDNRALKRHLMAVAREALAKAALSSSDRSA